MNGRLPGQPDTNAALSDADLVQAARGGDKRAFVEIVARHQAMVCGVALGIVGDFAASEDAGQDAFLTAWRKINDLREPERLRGWLAQIARNAALGQLRRKRGHGALDEALLVADQAPDPSESAASEEEAALVRESLAKLPENYRLPLVLFYREGKSVRAVAATLDISEDAVKQRLARGREMLQERMSGLIETVLTRTRPSAVFTILVAGAIGALAAPSAIAGTVFAAASAASAAGASTTSASTATLFTAMSTSKVFLAAAAAVAIVCIPIGYQLRPGNGPQLAQTVTQETQTEAKTLSSNATPTFENSPLFAEWRQLHERYGTNAVAMPLLYKAINELKDSFRRQAFRTALIAEWAQVDIAGGVPFFLGKGPDDNQRLQFFQEALARDPKGTVAALLANNSGWDKFPFECLPDIARRVPANLPEIVSHLPTAERFYDTNVRDAFGILAGSGLAPAIKAAESVTGPNRSQAFAGIAGFWAKTDLDAAVAWAKALPDGTDRDEIIRGALVGKAAVDPVAALDALGLVPTGGRYAHFGSTTGARVLETAAETAFDATVAWVAAHPGRVAREDLDGLSYAVSQRLNADATGFLTAHTADGSLNALVPAINHALLNNSAGQNALVWDWLKTQPETDASKGIRRQVLNSAAWQNPELALQFVGELPQTPKGDAELQELARCLFNGGNLIARFDRLYPEAPERLRQPLLEQAFASLSGDYMDEPQRWLARLSMLPESERPKAIGSLARAWTQQTPEDAVAWAASLGSGESQNQAAAAIARTWAAQDAHSAADWVASLPPGAERDHGAESLVLAVADQFPREAWDWALSINDISQRDKAATRAARAMAKRDPATARQWIEAGPFTAASKTELLAAMQKPMTEEDR